MANRYWIGGSGTWNASNTTNWSASSGGSSGASVPTAADSVFFDQTGPYTVTISILTAVCLDFNVTGSGTVTITNSTTSLLTISGNVNITQAVTWWPVTTFGFDITLNATTTGKTLNFGPSTFAISVLTINGVGGGWSLTSTWNGGLGLTITLLNGALDLNGFEVRCGYFISTIANTRSVAFGTNYITTGNSSGVGDAISMATLTGWSYTGTGGFKADALVARTYTVGSTAGAGDPLNAPNLTLTGTGTVAPVFTTSTNNSYFNSLDFGTTAFTMATKTINVNSLTLSASGTYTALSIDAKATGTITSRNKTIASLRISSGIIGQITSLGDSLSLIATGSTALVSGTLNLNGFDLTTGSMTFSASTTARRITFGSNNIVLAHTTAGTTVLSMATASNFSYTGTGGFKSDASITRTYTFGTTGGSTTNAPNLTLTGSGTAVQTFTTGSYFNTLSFGTTAFNPGITSLNLNGLTLSSGGTFTNLTPTMVGTGTITSNTNTTLALLTINGFGITTTLGGTFSLSATSTVTLTAGTLVLNGFTLTTGIFSSSNSNTRAITFGSNNIVLAHTTAAQTVLSMATATGFTYTGAGGFRADASVTRTYEFGTVGGSAANAPNLTITGSGTQVQTFNNNSWFNTLSFSTTAFNPGILTLNLSGLTLSSGGTFTGLTVTMVGSGTITSNTRAIAALTITTGTTTLGDALSTSITSTTTLTSGTLVLNGFDLTTGSFSSNNANTRTITLGANNIVLAHTTAAQTVLDMATATGLTLTGTGGFKSDASITRTYTFGTTGGTSANSPNLSLTGSGTAVQTFTTGSYFNTLSFGTTAFDPGITSLNLNGLTLSSGGTFTTLTPTMVGTGTITSNTNTTLASLTINGTGITTTLGDNFSLTATSTTTLTTGTLALNGFNLTTGIFSSSNSNTRAIAFSIGSIVLAHTTAATTVLSMATATGLTVTGLGSFRADASVTRTYTFGTTGGTSANSPNLTITGSGTAVQTFTTGSWFGLLSFGTTAFDPGTTSLNLDALTLSSGGAFTNLSVTMVGTGTITSNSKTIAALTITAGTTILGDALTTVNTGTTTLTAGTLILNGFNLTTGSFSSNNANTRAITFGANNIVLSHATAAQTVLNIADSTGLTLSGTGGFTSDAAVTRTYVYGTTGSILYQPNLSLTGSGTAVQTFTTGSYFNSLNFGTTAFNLGTTALSLSGNLTLSSGGTFSGLTATLSGTSTVTSNTNTTLGALTISGAGITVTLGDTLTMSATSVFGLGQGTLTLNGFNLTTGRFASSTIATRSINFGTNNIILAHTTAATTVLSMADATSFTYTGTGGFTADASDTRTYTFGTTGGSATNAPNLTLTGSGTAVQTFTTGSWFNTLNFGTTIFDPGITTLNLNGLTLSSGGTFTGLTPTMVGTGTITSNGKTLAAFVVNTTGTATLAGALTASGAITLTQGTLACSTYAVTSDTFASTGTATRSMTGSGTYTITGAGNAFSNASGTGITMTGFTISMTAGSAKTFAGGGGTYPILNNGGGGLLTISGSNTFDTISNSVQPTTFQFTSGTTQTVNNFNVAGTSGNLVTISSSTAGTAATLSKASGTVYGSYLSIQDSTATGGATWIAQNSIDVSNNSGWNFTSSSGMFLMFN